MQIRITGYTAVGTKVENEDTGAFAQTAPDSCYAVVCDGLGGHGGGRDASMIAAKALADCGQSREIPTEEQLMAALTGANQEILRRRNGPNHMKTTAVFLYVRGRQARWGHIGDTRLYHFYNGDLVDYTVDHSLGQVAVKMGDITRREIPEYPGRSTITQVLGEDKFSPEFHKMVELQPGDHAFLLCSDGLWERLHEDEILLDLHKSATPEDWIFNLRVRAEMRNSTSVDNNTAAAIFIKE